jgi:hypothetical protein
MAAYLVCQVILSHRAGLGGRSAGTPSQLGDGAVSCELGPSGASSGVAEQEREIVTLGERLEFTSVQLSDAPNLLLEAAVGGF